MKDKIENFLELCNDVSTSNVLFAKSNIEKILSAIATTPQVYELIAECMTDFDKEVEFAKAFDKATGTFKLPQEEYKIIALVFCILADIGNGKINFEQFVHDYFTSQDGKMEISVFANKVIKPFEKLIAEAFNYGVADEEQYDNELPSELDNDLNSEIELQTPNFYLLIKSTAMEMLYRLKEEKQSQTANDVSTILQCLLIACYNQDFDLVKGYVVSLKYACHGLRSLRHYQKALNDIIASEIEKQSKQ